MNDLITSKKVTRWYYKGKGYSSKRLAYKKLAYRHLLDEVLGENIIKTNYDDYGHSWERNKGRSKLQGVSDAKATIHDLFAEKFPHTDCDETTCWKRYLPDGETEDGYLYDTCRKAQRDWINQKADELIATVTEHVTPSKDNSIEDGGEVGK